jgi:hypothetical protein
VFQEQAEQEATHVQVPPGVSKGAAQSARLELRTSRALEAHPDIGDVVVGFSQGWDGIRAGGRRREPGIC